MHLGELSGWTSVALGQLVSWPQVLKLRRERGDGVSLASYAIVLVSMSLFLVHAVAIGDPISMVSVPLSLIPNVLIAVTLVRRRHLPSSTSRRRSRSLRFARRIAVAIGRAPILANPDGMPRLRSVIRVPPGGGASAHV